MQRSEANEIWMKSISQTNRLRSGCAVVSVMSPDTRYSLFMSVSELKQLVVLLLVHFKFWSELLEVL